MSRRATEQGAVNVGQGFPDYPIDPDLAACVTDAVSGGLQPVRAHGGQRPRCASPLPRRSPPRRPHRRPRDRAHHQLRRHRIYLLRHPGRGRPRATRPSSSTRPTTPTIRRSASPAGAASTFRCGRRISATTGTACADLVSDARGSSSSTIRTIPPAPWPRAADLDALRLAADAATVPSPCWPTRCTSTCCTTAACTSRS